MTAIPRGTVFHQRAGGGGGYGDGRLRPVELVAAEVRDGVISPEAARRDYGVDINQITLEERSHPAPISGHLRSTPASRTPLQ